MGDAYANAPGYWMYETSGVLRPVIEAYLAGAPMTAEQVGTMRAYLRQWIAAPGFVGPDVDQLRRQIDGITSRFHIKAWLEAALDAGIDPL